MESNELKSMILDGAMKQDGISPGIRKWWLRLEEEVTRLSGEVADLRVQVNHIQGADDGERTAPGGAGEGGE